MDIVLLIISGVLDIFIKEKEHEKLALVGFVSGILSSLIVIFVWLFPSDLSGAPTALETISKLILASIFRLKIAILYMNSWVLR